MTKARCDATMENMTDLSLELERSKKKKKESGPKTTGP